MQKQKMNLSIKIISIFIVLSIVGILSTSCGGSEEPICDTSSSEFMNLYNSHPNADGYTLDIQTMQYTFRRSISGNICSVGYEGHPNLVGTSVYKIEIIDNTSNTILHTGTYNFTAGSRSYQTLTSPVAIVAGQKYTIRRTVTNYGSSIGNTISHLKQIPSPFIPIVNGNMTIESTSTYEQYTAPTPYNITNNAVLPCIDIIFEQ